MKNGLYIVATPIGNLNDISFRANESLKGADIIICENPKHSTKLLSKLGIKKKLIALHDYNEDKVIQRIKNLVNKQIVILISDAGSPLLSDPGYKLVKYCIENKIFVTAVPGPSALLPALQLSTIPFNEFQFLGFAPKTIKSLNEFLIKVSHSKITSVFFVSSHRIEKCIKTAVDILKNRKIAVCKEITKINENTFIGLPFEVLQKIERTQKGKMGEFVVVVERSPKQSKAKEIFNKEIEGQIVKLLEKFSLTDVVEIVHKISYIAKKEIYKKALKLKK